MLSIQLNKVAHFFIFTITFAIAAQTPVKLSSDQFEFTEGPAWDGTDKIYFTDIPNSKIITYKLSTNNFSEVYSNTNRGNGLMFSEDYDLIICEGDVGKITKRSATGTETLIAEYESKRFNSPNDLCVDKKGGIYFTDPTWSTQYQPSNNLYYLNKEGIVTAEDTFGNDKPNGVIISPNGANLYVNNSWSTTIYRYDIDSNTGKLSNRINFATLVDPDDSNITGADGMAVDINGNLYVTAKFTLQIFNAAGNLNSTINFPEKTTNCTFGGVNKQTLFVTAGKNLYKLDIPDTIGFQHPFDLEEDPSLNVVEIDGVNKKKVQLIINSNPIINKVISLSNANGYNYSIKSLGGQLIKKGEVVNNIIDVSNNLGKGVYIIQFSKNQTIIYTKKIIIN